MASAMPSEPATQAALAAEGRTFNPSRLASKDSIGVSLTAGIVFFYGRTSYNLQARTGDAAPRLRPERHRKKRTLFPSSIECRTASKVSRTPRRIYVQEAPVESRASPPGCRGEAFLSTA
jgi:hypothetical protein